MPNHVIDKRCTYCIDVSASVSDAQITRMMDRVSDEWNRGDGILVFDSATAEHITFEDAVSYSFGKNTDELRMKLFKRGAACKWRTNGAYQAFTHAVFTSKKICYTDGLIHMDDLRKFNVVIVIDNERV